MDFTHKNEVSGGIQWDVAYFEVSGMVDPLVYSRGRYLFNFSCVGGMNFDTSVVPTPLIIFRRCSYIYLYLPSK